MNKERVCLTLTHVLRVNYVLLVRRMVDGLWVDGFVRVFGTYGSIHEKVFSDTYQVHTYYEEYEYTAVVT